MTYRLTRKAAADLRHIFIEGMTRFGLAQAERYHARLRRTFELLADNPEMARERLELSPPARVDPCGSHIIIYVVGKDGGMLVARCSTVARIGWRPREPNAPSASAGIPSSRTVSGCHGHAPQAVPLAPVPAIG